MEGALCFAGVDRAWNLEIDRGLKKCTSYPGKYPPAKWGNSNKRETRQGCKSYADGNPYQAVSERAHRNALGIMFMLLC